MSEERETQSIYIPQRGFHEQHAEHALSNEFPDVGKMKEDWNKDSQYRRPQATSETCKGNFQLNLVPIHADENSQGRVFLRLSGCRSSEDMLLMHRFQSMETP